MNINKKRNFLHRTIIILLMSIPVYSQEVIVPKIIPNNLFVSAIYKDILVGYDNDDYRKIFGYNRKEEVLWTNNRKSKRFNNYSLGGGIVDSQGTIHQYNDFINPVSIKLDLTSGIFGDLRFYFRYDDYSSISISNNDYVYRKKNKNDKDFLSKINTQSGKIVDISINDICDTYNNSTIIDIDENILFTSYNCLLKIDSFGKTLLSDNNISAIDSPFFGTIMSVSPNGDYILLQVAGRENIVFALDKNLNFLWKHKVSYYVNTMVSDKENNVIYIDLGILYYLDANGNIIWQMKLGDNIDNIPVYVGNGLLLSDNNIIYVYYNISSKPILSAISDKGKLLWQLRYGFNFRYFRPILDQLGILYAKQYKIQTSSKGLLRGGWPMKKHDPRRTNNASAPIYLKEYPNNNDHKKVICEVNNKTIAINKLTHLNKGWHLLGNSYQTKDYCPFSNIDYVYYYDTTNNKFNKININDESTHKTIPKHSGLFIYNKYDDNLTIYYDKEEILEKDKNIIDKEYINTLSKGWHLLGSSDSINDMSIFKDVKDVYIYDNTKGYTTLDSKSESNSIKEYSGFWVHK